MCLKKGINIDQENINITTKQENKEINQEVDEFVEKFIEDMEIKTNIEGVDTPVLINLFNDFIQTYNTPNDNILKIQETGYCLKENLEKSLNKEQKILLRKLTFCYYDMQNKYALESFVYGYSMACQMKNESVRKYPRL